MSRSLVVVTLTVIAAFTMARREPIRAMQPQPGVFRVMTFNIQHGIDGGDKYHLQSAIDTIARINPDIVALQEVTRNHPYYNCEDQPKLLADGVSRATGRHWTFVYQQQWFTPNTECVDAGRGDGKETEGLEFLAPDPLAPPTHTEGWASAIGLATESTKLPKVPIAMTHLAGQTTNAAMREKQLERLLPWLQRLGAPRILVGDFNTWPDSGEMQPLFSTYRDAWADAVAAGTARGRTDGITHGKHRIDYVFYVPGGRLELVSAETVDTVPLIGREASDHRPVVASFRVR